MEYLKVSGIITAFNGNAQISLYSGVGDEPTVKITQGSRVRKGTINKPKDLAQILLFYQWREYAKLARTIRELGGRAFTLKTPAKFADVGLHTLDPYLEINLYDHTLIVTDLYVSLAYRKNQMGQIARNLSIGALTRYITLFSIGQFDQIAYNLQKSESTPL